MKRNTIAGFILMVLMTLQPEIAAQETIRIVTRKMEHTFPFNYKTGQVIINTERGNITIHSWDLDEVKVVLNLSVKNADLEQAKKELALMQCNMVRSRGNVFVNNKMVMPAGIKEISSIITAAYTIYVPKNANMLLSNKYGWITISNAAAKIDGNLQYSDLNLQSFQGDVHVDIAVGDIAVRQSVITGTIKARHANIELNEISGKILLNTSYGSLRVNYGDKPGELTLVSYATDILLKNRDCTIFTIKLNGNFCPLSIEKDCYTPDTQYLKSTYESEKSPWILEYQPPSGTLRLSIQAKFGTLNML